MKLSAGTLQHNVVYRLGLSPDNVVWQFWRQSKMGRNCSLVPISLLARQYVLTPDYN